MKQILACSFAMLLCLCAFSRKVLVKNEEELKAANKKAQPGDTIELQNGTWSNMVMKLDATGTEKQPILFRAQTAGKVIFRGVSQLRLGGSFLVIDGFYFTNGYAPGSVIDFRISDKQLANHCRITNTVINDFNKPKRMSEDYWVSFSGKNNRIDHCSFLNKKNLGVLMAVILDDERSRENFHSIDHNYFGVRPPLASNAGEIIRVGVSQHCQFNSNTHITDNFFEQCDGETEIISIKSCSNVVRNNVFKECQGDVVLRHGNDNTVENNIFIGNDKEGTGGVRVINRGQWIVNNLFYKCRGVAFRSPLSIMNGVPNSPANRYVQVTDAVIANNSFYNCTPVSFCEGSDAERSMPPDRVYFFNNTFYNNRDTAIYHVYDNVSGIHFDNNVVSNRIPQELMEGFDKSTLSSTGQKNISWAVAKGVDPSNALPDQIKMLETGRLGRTLSGTAGFSNAALVKSNMDNAVNSCGARWFRSIEKKQAPVSVNCATAAEIYRQLEKNTPSIIRLTGSHYSFDRPMQITSPVVFLSGKQKISFTAAPMVSLFFIRGKAGLVIDGLQVDGKDIQASHFISSDTSGSAEHYTASILNSSFENFSAARGCMDMFHAFKYSLADSIVVRNNNFYHNESGILLLNEEKEDKGYYNAEKLVVTNNRFRDSKGALLDLYRGGNDESTMGPNLIFKNNKISNCQTEGEMPLIQLTGTQKSNISQNLFEQSNASGILILYKDTVRADHVLTGNQMEHSGTVKKNAFVRE